MMRNLNKILLEFPKVCKCSFTQAISPHCLKAFTSNLIQRILRGLDIFPFRALLTRSKQHTIFVRFGYFSAIVGYFVMLLSSQLLQYSTKHNQFCILEWLYNGIAQVFDWNLPPTSPEMQEGIFFYSFPQVHSIEVGMTMIQIQEGET